MINKAEKTTDGVANAIIGYKFGLVQNFVDAGTNIADSLLSGLTG